MGYQQPGDVVLLARIVEGEILWLTHGYFCHETNIWRDERTEGPALPTHWARMPDLPTKRLSAGRYHKPRSGETQ